MTKPEAEALMVRLEQIWEAEPIGPQHYSWSLKQGVFEFVFDLPHRYRLRLNSSHDSSFLTARLDHRHFFLLMSLSITGVFKCFPLRWERRMLALKCVPILRRNLWLSGCNVESSAHEQVEWTLWFRGIQQARTSTS